MATFDELQKQLAELTAKTKANEERRKALEAEAESKELRAALTYEIKKRGKVSDLAVTQIVTILKSTGRLKRNLSGAIVVEVPSKHGPYQESIPSAVDTLLASDGEFHFMVAAQARRTEAAGSKVVTDFRDLDLGVPGLGGASNGFSDQARAEEARKREEAGAEAVRKAMRDIEIPLHLLGNGS